VAFLACKTTELVDVKCILMHQDHNTFVQAVKDSKNIILTYFSGVRKLDLTELCIPIHYSPPVSQGGSDCYYFWDPEAEVGQ
jgi:hypothetical protein